MLSLGWLLVDWLAYWLADEEAGDWLVGWMMDGWLTGSLGDWLWDGQAHRDFCVHCGKVAQGLDFSLLIFSCLSSHQIVPCGLQPHEAIPE